MNVSALGMPPPRCVMSGWDVRLTAAAAGHSPQSADGSLFIAPVMVASFKLVPPGACSSLHADEALLPNSGPHAHN